MVLTRGGRQQARHGSKLKSKVILGEPNARPSIEARHLPLKSQRRFQESIHMMKDKRKSYKLSTAQTDSAQFEIF